MRLSEAFDHIEQWSREGEDTGICVRRYGYVIIDRGGLERGFDVCPVCGAATGAGHIVVSHDDGRRVRIDVRLYHYAQAGHPISREQLDSERLLAILAEAHRPPAALANSRLTLEEALAQVQQIQEDGEKVGPYVRRAGHIMVHVGGLKEGRQYCIHCGQALGKGQITVMHADQRMVSFDVAIYHYAEAGHPIAPQQLDSRRLLAMLADR